MSLPAWGVWIEISTKCRFNIGTPSLPAWGVWIEILDIIIPRIAWNVSLPAWGVWIEIVIPAESENSVRVTPRMGSVD